MSLSDQTLDSLIQLTEQAKRQARVVNELSGKSEDGRALEQVLDKVGACVELLNGQRDKVLYEQPSVAHDREEIAFLRARLQQQEVMLAKAGKKKGFKHIDFVPGLAYNVHAPPSQSLENLMAKLELVDLNLLHAVPNFKVPRMMELSQDVLQGLTTFVPYLQPMQRSLPDTVAPTLTEVASSICRDSRELAELCPDAREREAIQSATGAFEANAAAFLMLIRKPPATVEGMSLSRQMTDTLRNASALASVIAPRCLGDLVPKNDQRSVSYEMSSTD